MEIDDSFVARHKHDVEATERARILVDLTPFGMTGRFEELGVKFQGGNQYAIRSIPFFPYGVSYGDIVMAEWQADRLLFKSMVERCGHRTLRIAFRDRADVSALHNQLHRLLEESGANHEWHAAGFVAVDLPTPQYELPLMKRLDKLIQEGLVELEIDG